MSVWSTNESSYNELKLTLLNKTAFCHYAQGTQITGDNKLYKKFIKQIKFEGQTYFDYKLYMEALESFNKASELLPNNINYKIRRFQLFNFYISNSYQINTLMNLVWFVFIHLVA